MSNESHAQPHILPLSLYLGVGGVLIGLTALTVYVSFFDFGEYNLIIAMLIAATKASLVALFFMHLKYDNKLYMLFFVGAIFFLAVFIILTMFDTLTRADINPEEAGPIRKEAAMYDSLKANPHGEEGEEGIESSLKESTDTVDVVIDSTK